MSVQIYNFGRRMFYLLLILTSVSLISSSVVQPFCSHQPHPREPSIWATRLQAENQLLNLDDLNLVALQEELGMELSELAGLIDAKKNRFTRDELRHSYNYCDLALKTMKYDFLVSSTNTASPNDLSGAYNLFQRLALAVEVVRLDIHHHEDVTVHTRHLWHRIEAKIDDLLKLLYVVLGGEGEIIGRHVLPLDFTCVHESVSRDYRDFLVLRHILEAANLYKW